MTLRAAGGTLVVQYNTNNRISRRRRDPSAPSRSTSARSASPTRPRRSTSRLRRSRCSRAQPHRRRRLRRAGCRSAGLYFAETWDPRYQTPLRDARPRRAAAARAALLVARHGKGAFVYTGLAFFRQLPAGVPGAYRLFANLLAAAGRVSAEPPDARRAGRRAAAARRWRASTLIVLGALAALAIAAVLRALTGALPMSAPRLGGARSAPSGAHRRATARGGRRGVAHHRRLPARRQRAALADHRPRRSWRRRRAPSPSCRCRARPTRTAWASCSSTSACRWRW